MRRGLTIFEIMIALTIATLLTIALFNVLTNSSRVSQRTLDTLAYLRDASLLMEHVKRDIRSASRNSPRETIAGSSPRILTYHYTGVEMDIQYSYDPAARTVTRRDADGNVSVFGRGQTMGIGHITEFKVTPVDGEGNENFFQVLVAFANPRVVAAEEAGTRDPKNRPKHHRVQALVNRRTPSDTDDKWKRAFSF